MYTRIKLSECKFNSGIKVRIYPSSKQKEIIRLNSNISRFVYNQYVELGRERYKINKSMKEELSEQQMIVLEDRLAEIKDINFNPTNLNKIYKWLKNKDIDPQTKYFSLKAYKSAWNMWRKNPKSKPPTYKKRGSIHKYTTDTCLILSKRQVKINKIGVIRMSGLNKRKIHSELYVGRTTITMDSDGKYYLSISIASKEPFSRKSGKTGSVIGLDVNLSNFLVDSNGVIINNPKFEKRMRAKLKKEQRSLSRKYESAKREKRDINFARNYQKQRQKVAAIYKRIANQREDFQHKLSANIVENQDYIFVENIRPSQLNKNRKLSRAIADAGWTSFFTMLEYKSLREDKVFIKVDPRYTTQTCSDCSHVMSGLDKIKLGVEKWSCPECKTRHNRDHNAAINIMKKGLELIQ